MINFIRKESNEKMLDSCNNLYSHIVFSGIKCLLSETGNHMNNDMRHNYHEFGILFSANNVINYIENNDKIQGVLNKYKYSIGTKLEFKYLNYHSWLPKYVYIARALLMHTWEGGKILDIGSGTGWMSLVAKLLNHSPIAIDVPDRPSFYNDLCNSMDIPVIEHRIKPFTKLTVEGKFDTVIALMSAFYLYNDEWTADAWRFFINDLETHVNSKYIILIEMNHSYGRRFPRYLYDLFIENNYRIYDNFIWKTSGLTREKDDYIFETLAMYDDSQILRIPFKKLWDNTYTSRPSLFLHFISYLEKLYPQAIDVQMQKALFMISQKDNDNALRIMLKSCGTGNCQLGFHLILARFLFYIGNINVAIMCIEAMLKDSFEKDKLTLWLDLFKAAPDIPLKDISPMWDNIANEIKSSAKFDKLVASLPASLQKNDILGWYFRGGVFNFPNNNQFDPIKFWGIYENVLAFGDDPLIVFVRMPY